MIRCPHCQESGCDGRCRFRVGRRGFIGLALGAAAAAVLPAPRLIVADVTAAQFVGAFKYTEMPVTEVWGSLSEMGELLKKVYPPEYFIAMTPRGPLFRAGEDLPAYVPLVIR